MTDIYKAAKMVLAAWDAEDSATMDHPMSASIEALRATLMQQAAWVGLKDEEVTTLMTESWGCASIAPRNAPDFAQAIEAKLKEKNT